MNSAISSRLRDNASWRNERSQCIADPALLTEAADALETLMEHAEAMVKAIEYEGYRSTRLQEVYANFRAAFPGEG